MLLEIFLVFVGGFVALLALMWLMPALLTPPFRLLVRLLYRFHVHGADRVPKSGPVLLVGNHVTYIDWLLLWAASPRPLTFVLWSGFANHWFFRPFLSFARGRLISIDNAPGRPHATADALDRVVAALNRGEAVVVFAEGGITRNGQMRPFGRGIERILRRAANPVPVLPFYLDNLWGLLLSYDAGKLFGRWPTFRRRIAVYFGSPLPSTSTAVEVRVAVVEASADCSICESDKLRVPVRSFVRNAAKLRNLRAIAFVDVATGTERQVTWPKVLVGAWSLSRWLAARTGSQSHVGIWLPTGMGSALANLALGLLGKTTVNLNYTAGSGLLESAVKQSGIRHIVTSKRFLERIPLDAPEGVEILLLEDALASITGRERLVKFLAVLFLPGWLLERLIGIPPLKLDDVLTVIFSSGSTGEPKGVMLTHRNIAANTESFVRGVELHPWDRMLATLPFFHSFGYTVSLWAPAVVGMEAVFYPDPRAAKEVGELCKKHRCSIMMGTATFLRFYLRRCGADDFRSLRLLICGAEKLPVKLALEFHAKFQVFPLEGYGCTETSPVVSTNLHDVTVAGYSQRANTLGTIGQPIPGVAVKAFDPDTAEPLPPEVEGVLGVKGSNVMLGYLNQPERTRRVIVNGWYLTGDMGRLEVDGFIRITGRLSRFAKIAGEMVPLERVEEELNEVLETGGDRLLAISAVACERRGERLIVLHLAEVHARLDAAFHQLRTRGLPNLWIPDLRDCREVDAFPVLGSGKLDLRGLVELAKKLADRPA